MRFYEASAEIGAGPDQVWAVLADGAAWPTWDSGIDLVDGDLVLGKTITIRSQAAPGRAFPVKVTSFEPGRQLVLTGGMPLGLFKGVRTYSLVEPESDGRTRVHMREEYTGLLRPLIWRSMPDLGPSFSRFVNGLKRRVEAG